MNWKGFTIGLSDDGEGHRCQITGPWKPDKYKKMWWWKCLDCVHSSGVLSDDDLHELEARGFVEAPMPDDKDLSGTTTHPDESGKDEYCYYGDYY